MTCSVAISNTFIVGLVPPVPLSTDLQSRLEEMKAARHGWSSRQIVGIYTVGVYSLGVYSHLGLPILVLGTHTPVLKKSYRQPFNVNVRTYNLAV